MPKNFSLQGNRVCIKIDAADFCGWVVHIKEPRVNPNKIGEWSIKHIAQSKWTQRDVRALPFEREYALQ